MFSFDWLKNYVVGLWEVDKSRHPGLFKNILLDFGVDENLISDQISEVKTLEITKYAKRQALVRQF
jgi:hypothetical protein